VAKTLRTVLTGKRGCVDHPHVHRFLTPCLLTLAGCYLSITKEESGASNGSALGATSAGGNTSGSGVTSGETSGDTGGTSGGTASGSSGEASGGSSGGTQGTSGGTGTPLPTGPCGPGTYWAGDVCVVSCSDPVLLSIGGLSTADGLHCLLSDGGLGYCADATCLVPGDPNNCGGLGVSCPAPWSCTAASNRSFCTDGQGGEFQCDRATCPATAPVCFGVGCAAPCSPSSDNQACGDNLGGLGFCCAGVCHLGDGVVDDAGNLDPDPENCGGCGLHCGPGTTCLSLNGLPGEGCVSVGTCYPNESSNCFLPDGGAGACCDRQCVVTAFDCGPVASCAGAADGDQCNLPFEQGDGTLGQCCGSVCMDLQDPDNCGICGVRCGAEAYCAGGYCHPLLDCALGGANSAPDSPPFENIGNCRTDAGALGACCGPICKDLGADPLNCGSCGGTCPVGGVCSRIGLYACVDDGGALLSCPNDAPCPTGTNCVGGACFAPTCDGTQSFCDFNGEPGLCCGAQCTRGDHCGVCPAGALPGPYGSSCIRDGGPACGPGAVCPAGTICSIALEECISWTFCPPSLHTPGLRDCTLMGPSIYGQCCGDTCADLSQDPNNCGGCGVVCSTGICTSVGCLPASPTSDCKVSCPLSSVCFGGECIGGLSQNAALPFCLAEDGTIGIYCGEGACAHPIDDAQNCGSCGNACGPGQSCVAGSCTGRPNCGLGRQYQYCDLAAGQGFVCCPGLGCIDTSADPNNCGDCGVICRPDQSCVAGSCN